MTETATEFSTSRGPAIVGKPLRSPFILAMLAVFALFWAVTGAVIAIDPLDLYDWGEPPELLPDYNRHTNRELYMAAARTDADVLMLSSSTFAAVTAAQIEDSFGVDKAFNFATSGPRPADRRMLLAQVAEHSPARRVIVGFDYLFALPPDYAATALPMHFYDANPLNDLRIASPDLLRLTWKKLNGEPLALDGWEHSINYGPEQTEYATFQNSLAGERPGGTAPPTRASVTDGVPQDCAAYPLVSRILPELVDRLTARGKAVDFVIPPYSLRLYREWGDYGTSEEVAMTRPFLPKQIAIRRCLVQAFAGHANVQVFAFDNETWITADLTNYRDLAHLQDQQIYRYMVDSVAQGRHRLTPDDFDNYAATLVRNVERDAQGRLGKGAPKR